MESDQPLRVIYLGGYGRSGSTLLDQLLAHALMALGAGELCQLFAWAELSRECSCGRPVLECTYWGPVVRKTLVETGRSLGELRAITDLAEIRGKMVDEWQQIWTIAFAAMRSQGTTVIIDSSKTAGGRRRASLLQRLPNVEVPLFVILERSLPGVIHSRRRGNNITLEWGDHSAARPTAGIRLWRPIPVGLRATIGWIRANNLALSEAKRAVRYMRISYEELTADAVGTIAAISGAAGVSGAVPAIDRTHAIAGNRMLRAGWSGKIAPDYSWRRELPFCWKAWGLVISKLFSAIRRS